MNKFNPVTCTNGNCIPNDLIDELDELLNCDCGECTDSHNDGCYTIPSYLCYSDNNLKTLDLKRKVLEDYVNNLIECVGGNAAYRVRYCDYDLTVRAEHKGSRVKGLSGLTLSVDVGYKMPDIIRVEGIYQSITSQKDCYIEIGHKCIYCFC